MAVLALAAMMGGAPAPEQSEAPPQQIIRVEPKVLQMFDRTARAWRTTKQQF